VHIFKKNRFRRKNTDKLLHGYLAPLQASSHTPAPEKRGVSPVTSGDASLPLS